MCDPRVLLGMVSRFEWHQLLVMVAVLQETTTISEIGECGSVLGCLERDS